MLTPWDILRVFQALETTYFISSNYSKCSVIPVLVLRCGSTEGLDTGCDDLVLAKNAEQGGSGHLKGCWL